MVLELTGKGIEVVITVSHMLKKVETGKMKRPK